MSRPAISLIITDLDNTLYDWLGAFVPAFYAMVHEAALLMGVDEEDLLDDLQVVHRKHGDSGIQNIRSHFSKRVLFKRNSA
jgi:FMN phosphatase YigB (HAD superfamily)